MVEAFDRDALAPIEIRMTLEPIQMGQRGRVDFIDLALDRHAGVRKSLAGPLDHRGIRAEIEQAIAGNGFGGRDETCVCHLRVIVVTALEAPVHENETLAPSIGRRHLRPLSFFALSQRLETIRIAWRCALRLNAGENASPIVDLAIECCSTSVFCWSSAMSRTVASALTCFSVSFFMVIFSFRRPGRSRDRPIEL